LTNGRLTPTHRERQVLELLIEGYQNKEIAAKLNVAVSTVKYHVASLLRRYNVDGRVGLTNAVWKERTGSE